MCEADKRFARMLVGALNEAIEEQHGPQNEAAASKPLVDFGAELLGCTTIPAMKTMWYGFYLGFMQGCRFMAAADDPDGVITQFKD